jgi:polysaccharide deacetylase 2 family uncharacterized protein YibQ
MRRRKPRLLSFFLVLSLAVAVFTLGCIWFFKGSGRPSIPLYEEAYSGSSELAGIIRKIDLSVYDALYRSGIPERDVVFLNVEPRDAGKQHWEFTKLLIRCPDGAKEGALRRRIQKDLSRLGSRVKVRTEKTVGHALSISILVNGFRTHRVLLSVGTSPPEERKQKAKVALIIDDLGYDPGLAKGFMDLKIPVSLSVLPDAPFTRRIATEADKRGCELMVHLPMEPKRYPAVNPGPGTLFVTMDSEQILHQLADDLAQVPGAKGINNHMGSLFTEDRQKMAVVLRALKRRHLFFVDSRTTPDSVGYDLAKKMGIPTAKRTVFLDNDLHPAAIESQVRRLLNMARHKGWAIGIGHPHKETLRLLRRLAPGQQNGIEIVPITELLG